MGQAWDAADLVGAIYDAATGAADWIAVGDRLCGLLGAQMAFVSVRQPHGTFHNIARIPDSTDLLYSQYYFKLDPYRAAAERDAARGMPRVRIGSEIMQDEEFVRSEYYQDFGRHFALRHMIGARIDDGANSLLSVFRDTGSGAFSHCDKELLDRLRPHLQRGLQMRRQFGAEAAVARFGLAALDALAVAVILVDAAMRVQFANRASLSLVATSRSALHIAGSEPAASGGRCTLAARHRDDDRALKALVANAAARGHGGALRVRAPAADGVSGTSIAVLVSPAPASLAIGPAAADAQGLVEGQAIVIAHDLAVPPSPPSALLCDLFGLTSAEASVAVGLLGGRSAADVAEMRGVALDTVRTQIKSLLDKSEAANLRDFERLAASLALISHKR